MTADKDATIDPFLLAWGEVGAWRGVSAQSSLVSILPRALLGWNTQALFNVAYAVGQSQALRHHLVEQVDELVGNLSTPYLHRGMEDLRSGRTGLFRKWRRHCIKRAVSLCALVEQEHHGLSMARVQLEAWVRALDNALLGLGVQQEWVERVNHPRNHEREWNEFKRLLVSSIEGVELLRTHFLKLLDGVEVLRAKGALYNEVCNAVPNHEDILHSVAFSAIVGQLLALPRSNIPVCKE